MAKISVTYSATLNDEEDSITFPLDVSADQLLRGGYEWLEHEARLWIDNDEGLYREFYDGGDESIYDAEHENVSVEVEDDDE